MWDDGNWKTGELRYGMAKCPVGSSLWRLLRQGTPLVVVMRGGESAAAHLIVSGDGLKFDTPSLRLAIVVGVASLALTACIQAPLTPYEGQSPVRYGAGGARQSVDGVDVWTQGEPSGPYEILAYTTVESPDDWIGNRILLSRVASRVREARGDAAVFLKERSKYGAIQGYRDHTAITETRRVVQIAIVRYR